jgi:hypothetical protein
MSDVAFEHANVLIFTRPIVFESQSDDAVTRGREIGSGGVLGPLVHDINGPLLEADLFIL